MLKVEVTSGHQLKVPGTQRSRNSSSFGEKNASNQSRLRKRPGAVVHEEAQPLTLFSAREVERRRQASVSPKPPQLRATVSGLWKTGGSRHHRPCCIKQAVWAHLQVDAGLPEEG